jgi:hypothetical protein
LSNTIEPPLSLQLFACSAATAKGAMTNNKAAGNNNFLSMIGLLEDFSEKQE